MTAPLGQPEQKTSPITQCLTRLCEGDASAGGEALELLYPELHRMARRYMSRERRGHTLAPTELLNEAYLQLVDRREHNWTNRVHFLCTAAQAMRRILTDYARARLARKRGGQSVRVELHDDIAAVTQDPEQYLALEELLRRMESQDPELARIVEMRCFGGLTEQNSLF